MLRVYVGDGVLSVFDAIEEVPHVTTGPVTAVQCGDFGVEFGLFLIVVEDLVNEISLQATALDENVFFLTLEVDTVSGPVLDDDLVSVGELQRAGECLGRVVAVLPFVEDTAALDLDRSAVFGPDSPLCDVDVMGTPISHFSAGILQPPAELKMAALLDVGDQRRLAKPEVPIEFLWWFGFLKRSVFGTGADAACGR